jgi:hypothetical protein
VRRGKVKGDPRCGPGGYTFHLCVPNRHRSSRANTDLLKPILYLLGSPFKPRAKPEARPKTLDVG